MRAKMGHSKVIFVQGSEVLFCRIALVLALTLATEVAKADFVFGEPINLGPMINSYRHEQSGSISADGLSIFITVFGRPGGSGSDDLWVAAREAIDAPWGQSTRIKSIEK